MDLVAFFKERRHHVEDDLRFFETTGRFHLKQVDHRSTEQQFARLYRQRLRDQLEELDRMLSALGAD